MLNRRRFLGACSSALLVGTAPGTLLAAASRAEEMPEGSVRMPGKQQFAALLGETIQLRDQSWKVVDLQLLELKDLSASKEVEAFSLVFSGPDRHKLPSGTYTAWHERTGKFSLFVHLRDERPNACSYAADFCLLDSRAVKTA